MGRWAVAIVVAVLAVVLSLSAKEASPASSNPGPPPNDCSQRTIPLTVVRSDSSTLDWHSFNLTVGGRQVPIDSSQAAPQSPRVLVLLDTSGSMSASGSPEKWGVGLRAAAFAVDSTPLESSVSLGTFDEHDKFGKFESRQEAGNELVALAQQEKPKHQTALYGALKDAAVQFQPTQFGDTIFLVTDGGDNHSGELQKKAQQELIARGIRVFVFLVFDKDFKTAEEREAPELMTELAKATGGKVFEEPWSKDWVKSDEAKQLMHQIRTMTRWAQVLQFKLAEPLQKPAKLKISPSDPHALELAYPRQVLPCFALDAKSR